MIAMLALLLAVVNSPYSPPSYACDGVTAAFTVPFPYQASGDLKITSTTAAGAVTALNQGTDWSVNLSSTASTATLTLTSPGTKCPTGNVLKIERNAALTQPTSFRAQTNYNQNLHETAYDRAVMEIQQLNSTISALQLSGTATFGTPLTIDGTTANSTSGVSTNLVRADAKPATLYTPPWSGSSPRLFASKFSESFSIMDFGSTCDNTGATSNDTCFANARAQMVLTPGMLIFPSGTYKYSVSPNWAIQGLRLYGNGKVILNFTGAGNAWVFDGGNPTGLVFDVQMDNFTISGSASATNGLFLRSVHHSRFRNIKVTNVTASCLLTNFSVVNTYDTFRCSNNEGAYVNVPVNGINLAQRGAGEQTTSSTFITPIIEGVSGSGILLTSAVRNTFLAGTSEGNAGRGVEITVNSSANTFNGTDMEANAIEDVLVQGQDNQFINLAAVSAGAIGTLHISGANARRNMLIGGEYNNITIDTLVPSTRVWGVTYNFLGGGAFTDNGIATIKLSNFNANGGTADGPSLDNPMMGANTSASQSIPNNTSTIVVYGTVERDTDAAYNSGTGRYTVPAGKSGDYSTICEITFSANVAGTPSISIFKNAVEIKRELYGAPLALQAMSVHALLNYAVGDVIDCRVTQASGAAVTLGAAAAGNYFSLKRLP